MGKVSFKQNRIKIKAVFNSAYRLIYINKKFLNITKSNISIYLTELIQLRYSDKLYIINRFIDLDVQIKELKEIIHIKRGARVVKNLSIKLLIRINILGLKEIIINITKQIARIR